MKYIKRIIALPFVFVLFLISNVWAAFVATLNFLRYGGEIMRYTKHDKETIHNLYLLWAAQQNKNS
jgi:hypothetical protein